MEFLVGVSYEYQSSSSLLQEALVEKRMLAPKSMAVVFNSFANIKFIINNKKYR